VKLNDQSDDTAEPHPELGETGQNIAPADEIVTESDIELATTPPVVQQQEASRATTGSEQCYPTRSHQPPER
jgi:enhancing lycopene biosynthesis protein 2